MTHICLFQNNTNHVFVSNSILTYHKFILTISYKNIVPKQKFNKVIDESRLCPHVQCRLINSDPLPTLWKQRHLQNQKSITYCMVVRGGSNGLPKYRNPPTMYEIHCLKIEIHKVHKIHSKATLAKYWNPQNPQTVRIHIGKAVNKPTGNCYSTDIMYIQYTR